MQRPLDNLLQREMSRKEFLLTLGFGMVSLFGFSSLIKMLSSGKTSQQSSGGYGVSPYGGQKRR